MNMNLKNLLPFDNIELLTKLSVSEVRQRIESITEPRKNFSFTMFQNRTKPYEGEVIGDSFEISRIINYRNSFLPIIKGDISSYMGQTSVMIKMRPVIFVLVFMAVWLGAVGLVCLAMIVAGITQLMQGVANGFSPFLLIPFLMFAFGYGLITIAYKSESQKSKAFFKKLLEAEEH
jgi:hypothetical protein